MKRIPIRFGFPILLLGYLLTIPVFADYRLLLTLSQGETGSFEFFFTYGSRIARVGDVNGDGYDDLLIGAPGYEEGKGKVYLYLGGNELNGNADLIFAGQNDLALFGYWIDGAGDVNNDGFDDILIGAPGKNNRKGEAYIYFGGSSMDNIADVTMSTPNKDELMGYQTAGIGDVNQDGYDDVLVASIGYSNSTGRASILFGGNSMNGTADLLIDGTKSPQLFGIGEGGSDLNGDGRPDFCIYRNTEGLDTGSMVGFEQFPRRLPRSSALAADAYVQVFWGGDLLDSTPDAICRGEKDEDFFGFPICPHSDINGDGAADLLVGAPGYKNFKGAVYAYFGGTAWDTTPDLMITGEGAYQNFGNYATTEGDLNNDGNADIVISAPFDYYDRGKAFIYHGGPDLDGVADATLTGEADGYVFGFFVASGFDMNGDGVDELAVSALGAGSNGKVFVYTNEDFAAVDEPVHPNSPLLLRSYPNPCNPTATIEYLLSQPGRVRLLLYDVTGRLVRILSDGNQPEGTMRVQFDSGDLAGGVYILKLVSPGGLLMSKMVVVK